jgi:hypothetical protein
MTHAASAIIADSNFTRRLPYARSPRAKRNTHIVLISPAFASFRPAVMQLRPMRRGSPDACMLAVTLLDPTPGYACRRSSQNQERHAPGETPSRGPRSSPPSTTTNIGYADGLSIANTESGPASHAGLPGCTQVQGSQKSPNPHPSPKSAAMGRRRRSANNPQMPKRSRLRRRSRSRSISRRSRTPGYRLRRQRRRRSCRRHDRRCSMLQPR